MRKKNHKTILVLEDEIPLLYAVMEKLQVDGYSVLGVRTVKEALAFIQNGQAVDAIWLDHYLLGEQSGLDFVNVLRQNRFLEKTPIFVVSNTASADKIEKYQALGIKKYFTKANHNLKEIIKDIEKSLK
jgi:CheY-like chemotaxis protein